LWASWQDSPQLSPRVPDLLAMLRRRSSEGMNPRMGAIMGTFQVLWVYYGLLIASRLVILWNVIAVLINLGTVGAYAYYLRQEKEAQAAAAKMIVEVIKPDARGDRGHEWVYAQ